jgi:hypothetical protein
VQRPVLPLSFEGVDLDDQVSLRLPGAPNGFGEPAPPAVVVAKSRRGEAGGVAHHVGRDFDAEGRRHEQRHSLSQDPGHQRATDPAVTVAKGWMISNWA